MAASNAKVVFSSRLPIITVSILFYFWGWYIPGFVSSKELNNLAHMVSKEL
ncbi:hypothetical protein [Zobellella sp. DQSA1]|uniref:hypothetical protein n=1 Tax=Zobellella sp. DQSA1 TaxID=3342386 RepID=UPI0035C027D8